MWFILCKRDICHDIFDLLRTLSIKKIKMNLLEMELQEETGETNRLLEEIQISDAKQHVS